MELKTLNEVEKLLTSMNLFVDSSEISGINFIGISNNSKDVKKGDLFICKGFSFKEEYLEEAKTNGAIGYVAETKFGVGLPCIITNNIRKSQSAIAAAFNNYPWKNFKLIGITGTKGKTTTAYDLLAILNEFTSKKMGILSTTEQFVGDTHTLAHNTTAESLELQNLFARARDNGLPYVTMEVSSQAYKLNRVWGIDYDYGVFLNIGNDHISPHEHPTKEDYFNCKLELIKNSKVAIICKSTDMFEEVYNTAKKYSKEVYTFGIEDEDCDFEAIDIKKETSGFSFVVKENRTNQRYTYNIIQEGRFNVGNALGAICIARIIGVDHEVIAKALEKFTVQGRMNSIWVKGVKVIVDYAHNGMSFEALFKSLKEDYPNVPIWVLTGERGARARQRKIDIGKLCGQYADHIVLTANNPAFEKVEDICQLMKEAADPYGKEIEIILDRKTAIKHIIRNAPKGSIVIIAGKGSEFAQKIKDVYEPYESDWVIVNQVLNE